jgi:hypothetical protein
MPKQQKKRKDYSVENKLQFSLRMENTQLIWEKHNKYGKTQKKVGGIYYYQLIVSNKGKQTIMYRKTLRND